MQCRQLQLAHLALLRGANPHPRSGAAAESARLWRQGMAERSYTSPRSEAAAGRSYPMSKVRGSGRECQAATVQEWQRSYTSPRSGVAARRSYPVSKVRGSSRECQAAMAQEQQRGAIRVRGQGQQQGGATPGPRSSGCAGAGRPRGAIPHSRLGEAAVRIYPSSKVRSSGCTLLEPRWRDTPHPR